jgi:hypothetical protein
MDDPVRPEIIEALSSGAGVALLVFVGGIVLVLIIVAAIFWNRPARRD